MYRSGLDNKDGSKEKLSFFLSLSLSLSSDQIDKYDRIYTKSNVNDPISREAQFLPRQSKNRSVSFSAQRVVVGRFVNSKNGLKGKKEIFD
jgi:hypothetical protein